MNQITLEQLVAKVAEYLSIAPHLTEFDKDDRYQRVNQLALELAVWLPSELYIKLGQAIANPCEENNPGTVICEVRKLYGEGQLSPNKVIVHAPGIGKKD